MSRSATLYRMVMATHICPYGLKARWLLRRKGFAVDDHWLTTQAETDAFKAEHGVETTPQTFIDGVRIGGYDDLRRYFGLGVRDPKAVTYTPVIAIFAVTADPFLVFTSNVFAILGLRSLYFALAGAIEKFRYLKVSLAAVLALVGIKMLAAGYIKRLLGEHFDFYLLGAVLGILAIGVLASMLANRAEKQRELAASQP